MTSLQERRERGDMITTFRNMQGLDRVDRGTWFQTVEESRGARVRTRQDTAGQPTKKTLGLRTRQDTAGQPTKETLGLEVRRHFFSQRVLDPWNNLSESLTRSTLVNMFKNSNDEWMEGRGQDVQ